jgi:hypothetical protein
MRLDEHPAQRVVFVTFLVVTFVADQVHDVPNLFVWQVVSLLVQGFDELSGRGGRAFGF